MITIKLFKFNVTDNIIISTTDRDILEDDCVTFDIVEDKLNTFLELQDKYRLMQNELRNLYNLHKVNDEK